METRPIAPHRWFAPDIDDESRPRLVFEYVKAIEEAQADVRLQMMRNAYLYTGEELTGIRVDWERRPAGRAELPRINVVGSVIETAYSRMMTRTPRLAVVTKGGDWPLRMRARGMGQWIDGKFYSMKFGREWGKSARDGAALGIGLGKMSRIDDEITIDRIWPCNVVVDEIAAATSPPMAIFERRFVDLDELCAEHPDQEDLIWESAKNSPTAFVSYIDRAPYTVPVIEAYRRPWGSRPGMHLRCVEGGILGEPEPWNHPYLPYLEFRWQEKLSGWYGIGIPEIVAFLQARVNRHAAYEAACQNRAVSPVILVDEADRALTESITNELGQVVPWSGRTAPQFVAPPQVPPEIYADEDRKIRQIYQISGMSEFAAGGRSRPPTGLDSKPALEEWIDYQEGRFARQEVQYDTGWVEGAYMAIDLGKEIAAEGRMPNTTWNSPRYGLVEIDWSKVDMDRDQFRLRILPAGSTPDTPAGLRQRIEEERAAGRMADDLYRYFVSTLDTDAYYNLYDAAVSDLMRTVSLLEDGDVPQPAPGEYQALELGLWIVQMELNKIAGVAPQAIKRRFAVWMEQAEYLQGLGKGAMVGTAPQLGPAQVGGGAAAPQLAALGRLPVPGLAGA